MRTGLLGKKIGMSRIFTDAGEHIPVTLIDVNGCAIVGKRTVEKDGYIAVKVGYGTPKLKNVAKPQREEFAKNSVAAKSKVMEFRVTKDAAEIPVGSVLKADHFINGQYVDVVGSSTGKGFAGAMKRHNFSGLEASHGVSISHRSHGSTGGRQDPGKVFKNKKMAGHMGAIRVKVPNLEVVSTDPEKGLIAVRGCIPGTRGSYVIVTDAVRKGVPSSVPFPASIVSSGKPAAKNEAAEESKE